MAIEPLTPSDCDLRGLDYMPLFGNHLFGSEFNAAATDSEWRAALTLWWAAWNQVPAGSLPNDDGALCRLADLGRDVKTWKRLRERALHGFVVCADGRLYNEFLCKQVLVAWDKRVKERERKANWRSKKAGHDADVPRDKTGTEQGQDADVPADGKGRDGTGRDVSSSLRSEERARASPAEACLAMRRCGMADVNPSHPKLIALLDAGITVDELASAASDSVKAGKPFVYALSTAEGRRRDAAKTQKLPDKGLSPTAAALYGNSLKDRKDVIDV